MNEYRYSDAISDYDKFIERGNPHHVEAHQQRVKAHYLLAHYDFVISDSSKLIELEADSPSLYTYYEYRARAYYAQQDYGRAKEDFYQASQRSGNPLYYFYTSHCHYQNG